MFRRAVLVTGLCLVLPMLTAVGLSSTSAGASSPERSTVMLSLAEVTDMSANIGGMAFAALPRWAPSNYTTHGGPSFNNPSGSKASRRRNLDRVKRMVNAAKGYRVSSPSQCPKRPAYAPNKIRIGLYSFSDYKVANALIAAHRRCIAVQVLMNDHLSNRTVPAFGKLQKYLGTKRYRRSFARRCNDGCRGNVGPLHSKMFLFNQTGRLGRVVMFGSTNLTGKAANVQWNDLFVFAGRNKMWNQHVKIFQEMIRDQRAPNPLERNYVDGPYLSMFWPQPGHRWATDRVLRELRLVKCGARPTGGTGYAGHTGVAINIHAMEGERGLYLARHLVAMKRAGCRVRVLYGLIAPRIHRTLKNGRVPSRRTIFDRTGDDHADVYTHMKVVAINGVFNRDRSTRLVLTGSENFSHKAVGADEVWVRIPSWGAWRRYQNLFDMIWKSNYHSSPRYAFYSQSDTPVHARTSEPRPGSILVTQEDLEG